MRHLKGPTEVRPVSRRGLLGDELELGLCFQGLTSLEELRMFRAMPFVFFRLLGILTALTAGGLFPVIPPCEHRSFSRTHAAFVNRSVFRNIVTRIYALGAHFLLHAS